jgi:methionine synthase II (cobalamin-independent)
VLAQPLPQADGQVLPWRSKTVTLRLPVIALDRPKTKGVVLGLVSSKLPRLESIEALRRRTDEAVNFADAEHLAISP